MTNLSICIVSGQARGLLPMKTVDSLSSEVLIVDNHSDEGRLEMLNDEFSGVRLLANDHNTGYTRPNNQAMHENKGRYVVLLNPNPFSTR